MPNEFKTELAPVVPWDEGAPKINGPAVYGASPDKIRVMADNMVSSGLAARGYTYVNVDSCWQGWRNND